MTSEEAEKLLEETVAKLGEHFDAIQILGAWIQDNGSTKSTKRGGGLWHARIGLAHEFINSDMASDQAYFLAQKLNPPDEGDDWKAPSP